jgi:hypothetical protein
MIAVGTPDIPLNFSLTNPTTGNSLLIQFPNNTDDLGEFDRFIQLTENQVPNVNTVMSWPLYTVNVTSTPPPFLSGSPC